MRVYQHTVAPRQLYIIINNRSGGAGRLFPFIAKKCYDCNNKCSNICKCYDKLN
nr:MAG TPA: hypothetical protein [Caudoviricetes sp.]